jgi:hypothetical protein
MATDGHHEKKDGGIWVLSTAVGLMLIKKIK